MAKLAAAAEQAVAARVVVEQGLAVLEREQVLVALPRAQAAE